VGAALAAPASADSAAKAKSKFAESRRKKNEEKRKNFKELFTTLMAQPVGHRKDCSYCQIAPSKKQSLKSVSTINMSSIL